MRKPNLALAFLVLGIRELVAAEQTCEEGQLGRMGDKYLIGEAEKHEFHTLGLATLTNFLHESEVTCTSSPDCMSQHPSGQLLYLNAGAAH